MEKDLSLNDVVSYARDFKNFQEVLMAVYLHPEWLTKVPEGRKWAILHHIVLSGNVDHFDQILVSQQKNKDFRLLSETADKLNVLDIAKSYDHLNNMLKRVERLVKLDELLTYAKDGKWDECFEIVKENPEYGNQKPPYRRFYLIHHIAYSNEINQFKRFQAIEGFKFSLTLRVDKKRINDIAREAKCKEFTKFIEQEYPAFFEADDDDFYKPSEKAIKQTENINILMEQTDAWHESSSLMAPAKNQFTRSEVNKMVPKKIVKQSSTAASNIASRHPKETILQLLRCSLTNAVVTDPGKENNH